MRRSHLFLPVAGASFLAAGLALFLFGPARPVAALLVRYDFRELALRSRFIVAGEVLELTSYRAPFGDLGEVFFTDVKIQVEKALKGAPAEGVVTVQLLGGRVGAEGYLCRESAKYERGEKVLVFLRDYNQRLWNTGWLQGKYRIVNGTTVKGAADLPITAEVPLATVEAWVQAYLAPPPSGGSEPLPKKTSGEPR
jgi:hypothetical protein